MNNSDDPSCTDALRMDRRSFMYGMYGVAGAIVLLGVAPPLLVRAEEIPAPAVYVGPSLPTNPRLTGTLNSVEKKLMWTLFGYIGTRWKNGTGVAMGESQFNGMLDMKTTEYPSYLTEYRNALSWLSILTKELGNAEAALKYMFDNAQAQKPLTRQFVLDEMVSMQVASGGFRVAGYMNFPGFMGGPFNNQTKIPYRVWKGSEAAS
ncbi:MAG: hypothetical protein HQL82_03775 [Magnetococcales bacterium]|nr:hypothetical protein [Magnetococcales bacterium]